MAAKSWSIAKRNEQSLADHYMGFGYTIISVTLKIKRKNFWVKMRAWMNRCPIGVDRFPEK